MMTKVGYACGMCSRCGREVRRLRPVDYAVCDCWEYCPLGHKMEPYMPDSTPQTFGSVESSKTCVDLQHPIDVVMWCPVCRYYSVQKPVEVRLT